MRHSVLGQGRAGNWQNRSLDSQLISGADFMSPTLSSPHIQKSTKILMVVTTPHDQQNPSAKNMCFTVYIPSSPKSHTYLPFSSVSLKKFLRAIIGVVFYAVVLILPQVKLNLPLSHCVFFYINTRILDHQDKLSGSHPLWKFVVNMCELQTRINKGDSS